MLMRKNYLIVMVHFSQFASQVNPPVETWSAASQSTCLIHVIVGRRPPVMPILCL